MALWKTTKTTKKATSKGVTSKGTAPKSIASKGTAANSTTLKKEKSSLPKTSAGRVLTAEGYKRRLLKEHG